MRVRAKRFKRFQARGVKESSASLANQWGSPLGICFELTPANVRFARQKLPLEGSKSNFRFTPK
jgi:hypothetical protein